MTVSERTIASLKVSDERLARITADLGQDADPGFAKFMAQVDRIITFKTGLGVYDFADAPWRDLYDDLGEGCTCGDAFDTLSEYDETFAQMINL